MFLNSDIHYFEEPSYLGASNDAYLFHPFYGRSRRQHTNNAQRRRAREAAFLEYSQQRRDEEEQQRRIEEMVLLERQYLHQKKLQEEAQRKRIERERFRQYRLEEEAKRQRGLWLRELQKESERQQMMERMQELSAERDEAKRHQFPQIPKRNTLHRTALDSYHPVKSKIIRNVSPLHKIVKEPKTVHISDEDHYDVKSYNNLVVNELNRNTTTGKRITKTKSKVLIGEVEDVSDDEMDDSSSLWCNRRPNEGQWMEPVDGYAF